VTWYFTSSVTQSLSAQNLCGATLIREHFAATSVSTSNVLSVARYRIKQVIQLFEAIVVSLWGKIGPRASIVRTRRLPARASKTRLRNINLRMSKDILIELLEIDCKARNYKFDNGTYRRGVCLDVRKGSTCHHINVHHHCLRSQSTWKVGLI
jgi:hypothetical protein